MTNGKRKMENKQHAHCKIFALALKLINKCFTFIWVIKPEFFIRNKKLRPPMKMRWHRFAFAEEEPVGFGESIFIRLRR